MSTQTQNKFSRVLQKLAVAGGLLASTAACSSISTSVNEVGQYANPIGDALVLDNKTPYSEELECLAAEIKQNGRALPRIAVGAIPDNTGKFDLDGAKVTQGASLMAMSALSRLGLPLVERADMAVAVRELDFANNNLVSDGNGVRLIRQGTLPGSDFYLVGGITEINYNIRSVANELMISSVAAGARTYVLNIAIDLRLVETRTLKVAQVLSYQKQVIGREIGGGVFELLGGEVFDLSTRNRALEPIQLAVRTIIEKASADLTRKLMNLESAVCAST